MANTRRGWGLPQLPRALPRRRAAVGGGGALVGALVAAFAFTVAIGSPYAASAHLAPGAAYLNDTGALVTVVIRNTGTSTTIGAVQLRRPDNSWSIAACDSGPVGWSIQSADPLCRYRSADGSGDDIPVGGTASFSLRLATQPGSADRRGVLQVVVSSSNRFDNPSLLTPAAEGDAGLDLVAHSFQVLDAVVAGAPVEPGSACPAASHEALVGATTTVVICGRNRANVALTPSADHSSLGGTFLADPGSFSSAPIAAESASSVVLGNWTGALVRSIGGSDLSVVAVVAASTSQTSPATTFAGYTALNDPPTAGADGPYATLEDQQLSVAAPGVLANDSDPDGHPLTLSVTQAPAQGTAILNPDGSFTYDPAADFNGSDSFTYTADDGHGGTDTASVSISVTSVNDAPTFSLPVASHDSSEDAGAQSVPGFATTINSGPGNESGQALAFDVSTANAALFAVPPAISTSGELSYEANPDAFGSALVTATLRDDGGTADGGVDASAAKQFTINVNSVNDAPSFSLPLDPDQLVVESAGLQTVGSFASGISAGPANEAGQSVEFVVSNDNAALFATPPAIAQDGTLTYAAADEASGSALVTVAARDDGGTANGGVDTSAGQAFTITVTGVNDPPTASAHAFGTAVGNTRFAVGRPAEPGPVVHASGNLLDGASDPDGPAPLRAVAGTVTTAGAGTAVVYEDGTFTYMSAAGEDALTDSFSYQVEDGSGAASPPASVQIALSGDVVWYVDNAAAGGGDGRSNAPFSSLGTLTGAADPDGPGDILFVYSGTAAYAGGLTLESGQQLIGQPAGLTVAGQQLVAAGGPRPDLTGAAGSGLTLASGVTVRSMEVSASGGDGIVGFNPGGTVTIADVAVHGSAGDNAGLFATSGSLTLAVSGSTFRDNSASTGGHGLRLTVLGTADVDATVSGSTFSNNRVAGIHGLTVGGGTLRVSISDSTLDTNFNGIDLVHAGGGNLTATVRGNTITSSATNGGAPINLFLSSHAGSAASSVFSATVDDNVVSNNGSTSAPGIWYHTGSSAGHARLLITGNDVSAIAHRGIAVEAGTGPSTLDATIRSNVVSLPTDGLDGIFVQAGLMPGDAASVCADISSNTSSSPASDIRVRQRFTGTTVRLPGYGGSGTDDAAVQSFLAGQNTVADVLASHESSVGFGGGVSCASP